MTFLTNFADQAVVLPVAAAILLGLVVLGWARGALAWGVCVAGVLAVMLVLKLMTFACSTRFSLAGLVSPSGHTAAAAIVYGGLLTLLAPQSRVGTGMAAAAGGGMAVLFGLTRLALHVHTPADILVGAAVGTAGAVLMRHWAGARPRLLASWRLALLAGVMMVAFHGQRMAAESRLHWVALEVWPFTLCRMQTGWLMAPGLIRPPMVAAATQD